WIRVRPRLRRRAEVPRDTAVLGGAGQQQPRAGLSGKQGAWIAEIVLILRPAQARREMAQEGGRCMRRLVALSGASLVVISALAFQVSGQPAANGGVYEAVGAPRRDADKLPQVSNFA